MVPAASDWFEVASANLNLGAYGLRVRPLPRLLKQVRQVSGWGQEIQEMGEWKMEEVLIDGYSWLIIVSFLHI